MAGKQLQEKDGDILTERGRQQDVRWKRQHAEQTDELYKKGKKKVQTRIVLGCVCMRLCTRGCVIGCGRE